MILSDPGALVPDLASLSSIVEGDLTTAKDWVFRMELIQKISGWSQPAIKERR